MLIKFFSIMVSILVLLHCQGKPFRLITGTPGGTYEKIGHSIKINVKLKMQLLPSKGSVENLQRLQQKKADFALCQFDVYSTSVIQNPELQKEVKVILPLYYEEMHLIVDKKFENFKELNGFKIAIGGSGSGTAVTANTVLEAAGVHIKPQNIDSTAAKKLLISGQLEGFFIMTGSPSDMLQDSNLGNVGKLLSLNSKTLKKLQTIQYYKASTIRKNTYTWQNEDIHTVASDVVLLARAEVPDRTISYIFHKIGQKKSLLIQEHQKWAQLDLAHARKIMSEKPEWFHPAMKELLLDESSH